MVYIHGCVDGFSRYLIWLEASYTNKDPRMIAGYYISEVEKNGVCPRIIRSDRGSENVLLCDIQRFMRRNHDDRRAGEQSFIYGTSTTNQRMYRMAMGIDSQTWYSILDEHVSEVEG